ncbi:MAG: hypothetical protein LBC74_08820 [Planctomycetaceae bacterium]|jgi:hypothetical protein|nr:hypothetical protein [Planctomycetaceae bacterium]
MKKINYLSIIFVCLFIVVLGCERVQPPNPSEEKRMETAEMLINNYVDEMKKQVTSKPIVIDVAAEIREIEQIQETDHNLRFAVLVRQLIDVNQISDAVNVLDKINDPVLQDTYLGEIVRLQLKELKNSIANNKSSSTPNQPITTMSGELQTIYDVIIKINNLLFLTELGIELATISAENSDSSGAIDILIQIADKVRNSKAPGIQRVKSLQIIADYFLKQDRKEQAIEFCKKSEEVITDIVNPIDSVFVMLDLSSLYLLLDSVSDAERVCDASIQYVAKITTPAEKATAILKIAETFSVLQIKFKIKRDVKKLAYLKKLILAVDPIIANHDSEANKDVAETKLTDQIESAILSWERIRSMRDMLLRGLVRHQVWLVPESLISLDEVWSTIHDIENDSLRDDAIIAAIDMLCITGSLEDAKNWADFINNADKKKDAVKKIDTKTEAQKKQTPINNE